MDPILKRYKMIEEFYHILDQWITLMEDGIGVDSILERRGYHKIVVWGMGTMALHFFKALERGNVSVEYVINNVSTEYHTCVKVISKDDAYGQIDAIIYTNPDENLEDVQAVADKLNCDVVYLADVIFDNMK